MDFLRALVVDDDKDLIQQAQNAFLSTQNIQVLTAESLEEAREKIREHFIHVAFVDLQLEHKIGNIDGKTILRELMDVRPSCRRFLLTKYPERYRTDFFHLLRPLQPMIHGALDKEDFSINFVKVLEKQAKQWMDRSVKIDNVSHLYDLLRKKKVAGEEYGNGKRINLTEDEVNYVISVLLGQDLKQDLQIETTPDDIAKITLDTLPGGRSRSIVALGRPISGSGQEGIYCVIKIGPRREAEEEYLRYKRYVQFLVSLNRRVELLGYAPGDTIGAVCYSFAGQSPHRVFNLESLFNTESPDALRHIRTLFNPKAKEWYKNDGEDQDQGGFFHQAYGLDPRTVLRRVKDFAEKVGPSLGASKKGDELHIEGDKLFIPKDADIGSGKLRSRYQSCIVHGDMNAGNVIIGDRRVIWIDFRHTARGPKSIDFAALQASIRLSSKVLERELREIVADHRIERQIWRSAWYKKPNTDYPSLKSLPYWATVSLEILSLLRQNFPDMTPDEHAATCFLYALRIFRVTELTDTARLRLLVWMSSLCDILRD